MVLIGNFSKKLEKKLTEFASCVLESERRVKQATQAT